MAEPYHEQLKQLVSWLRLPQNPGTILESKHFFSGAALYANGKIIATLNPAGLALKLPAEMRQRLIQEKKGGEFRFFATGPIKSEYVLLSESTIGERETLQELLGASIDYVLRAPLR